MIVEPVREIIIKPEMIAYIHGVILHNTSGDSYKVKVGRLMQISEEMENTPYGDVFQRAGQYADTILKHKPFSKGTRQTALTVALLYLRLNYMNIRDNSILVNLIIDLDNGKIDRQQFSKILYELSIN